MLTIDVRDALATCPVPVLYLRATRDRLVGPRNVSEVLAAFPLAQSVDIEAPHLMLQVAPSACIAAIDGFLESASSAHG
jgi:pimeloyl-ACP methyl ester carboxylesterase